MSSKAKKKEVLEDLHFDVLSAFQRAGMWWRFYLILRWAWNPAAPLRTSCPEEKQFCNFGERACIDYHGLAGIGYLFDTPLGFFRFLRLSGRNAPRQYTRKENKWKEIGSSTFCLVVHASSSNAQQIHIVNVSGKRFRLAYLK